MKKGASTTFLEPIKNLYIRYENDIVEILNNTFDYNSDAADYKCLMSQTKERAIEAYAEIFFKNCAVFEYQTIPSCMKETNATEKEERLTRMQNQESEGKKLLRNLKFYKDATVLKKELNFYDVQ